MVQYKLYYFDIPGLGEQIRMLFHFAGQKFEDVRINKDKDWATMKTKFLYQTVPVLEVDGKQLAQSGTIMKYLGKKFGIAGKDEWEEAKASEIGDFLKDISSECRPYMAIKMGFVKGDADKQRKETFLPAMEKFMPLLEKLLAEAGSGFMLPSGISYVDIQIAYMLAAMNKIDPEAMGKYPKLVEYSDRVHGQPKLKEYLAKRKA